MKILYGYPAIKAYYDDKEWTNARLKHVDRLVKAGFDIKPFCMNVSQLLPILTFSELDKKWRSRDKYLLSMYDRFLEEIDDCDVFYNSVGINFHPEFVESVAQFTVFGCNDDPESSNNLSKPVATSYDMCAIGNIAEISSYRSWGVKNVVWQPMGFDETMYDPLLSYDKILNHDRHIDLVMVSDKLSRPRRDRMRKLDKAFPNAHFYGRGWKRGFLPQNEMVEILQQSKTGINIHNSTGPINRRFFYLPANGVMQICDNKTNLSDAFKLNKEIIGFETIEECIDLFHYYSSHETERRLIAANGWQRAIDDYNEIAVFNRLVGNIEKHMPIKASKRTAHLDLKPRLTKNLQVPFYDFCKGMYTKIFVHASSIYRRFFKH